MLLENNWFLWFVFFCISSALVSPCAFCFLVLKMESNKLYLSSGDFLLTLMSSFTFFMSIPCVSSKVLLLLLGVACFLTLVFFLSDSSLLMWISFELTILPMLFSIFVFGAQSESLSASYFLASYALISGLPFFFIISVSSGLEGSWLVEEASMESGLFLVLPFLTKLPCYGLHLWLPLAHVEAPTSSSMVLAAVVLKLGASGLLYMSYSLPNLAVVLSAVGVVLVPLIATLQSDVKCLVAYSSVVHMSMLALSLFLLTQSSFFSSWLFQISHGFISGALFLKMGMLSHLLATRLLYYVNNKEHTSFFLLSSFNAGAPISLAFVGEVSFFSVLMSMSSYFLVFLFTMMLLVLYYNLYLFSTTLGKKTQTKITFISMFLCLVVSMNIFLLLI